MIDLVANGGEVAVTEPVEMELLNGEQSGVGVEAQRRFLRSFAWLPFVTATRLRRRVAHLPGLSAARRRDAARGTVDCMIAAVVLRNDVVLLTADRDLARIAEVMGIRLDPASVSR